MQRRPQKCARQKTEPRKCRGFEKTLWKPGTMLYPAPAVLVTSVDKTGAPNVLTVAWTGTICSEPPMLSISVRPERYSHELIAQSGEFVVNIPSVRQARAIDYCGVVSGRTTDKFKAMRLTPGPAKTVKAPLILECPLHIECKVRRSLKLGSHTMFLAEVTAVQATTSLITPSGRLALERAGLIGYVHGGYYALEKRLGFFGFSVQKKGKRRE